MLLDKQKHTVKADEEFDPTGKIAVLHVMLEKMNNRLNELPARECRSWDIVLDWEPLNARRYVKRQHIIILPRNI